MDAKTLFAQARSVVGFPRVARLVCLANSRKYGGRCMAGKRLLPAGLAPWVRPVSARPTQELNGSECAYEHGALLEVLDVVDVPVLWPEPHRYQTENWRLDSHWPPARVRRADPADLAGLVDDPPTLWLNNDSSSQGLHDRVALSAAEHLTSSLYLIRATDASLHIVPPNPERLGGKPRVQAHFIYRGVPYRLWVTDPVVEARQLAEPGGVATLGECYLTISLGEPFEDYCYKLVAAVIDPSSETRFAEV